MKKNITKKSMIVLTIILIAGFIASQAIAHMGSYNMMSGGQMGYGGQMMGYGGQMMGNLSAEDTKQMQDQMNTFFEGTKEIRKNIYQKQLELNKEYAKSEKDQATIDALEQELFDLSGQFEKKRFDHTRTMRGLFSGKENGYFMGGRYNGC